MKGHLLKCLSSKISTPGSPDSQIHALSSGALVIKSWLAFCRIFWKTQGSCSWRFRVPVSGVRRGGHLKSSLVLLTVLIRKSQRNLCPPLITDVTRRWNCEHLCHTSGLRESESTYLTDCYGIHMHSQASKHAYQLHKHAILIWQPASVMVVKKQFFFNLWAWGSWWENFI